MKILAAFFIAFFIPNAFGLIPDLGGISRRACTLKNSRLNFVNLEQNKALASSWRNLVVDLEAQYRDSDTLSESEIQLRKNLNQCAEEFLNNAFRDLKDSSLKFGEHALNQVVFWANRAIRINQASLGNAAQATPQTTRDIVKKYLENAFEFSLSGISYDELLKKIYAEVSSKGLDPSTIPYDISETQRSLEDHISFNGVDLREGDILLLFDDHALGDLAYPMIGIENLLGHAAMIFSGHLGPIKTYFVIEVLDKLKVSKLSEYCQSVVIRPRGMSLEGRTENMMKELKSRPFRFDAKFRDGLLDEKGQDYSLYCGEFVHYAYKNGFDPLASEMPSPFDFVNLDLGAQNEFLKANLETLGFAKGQRLYLPEQLFFNPKTEIVGILRYAANRTIHPSRLRFASELESRFYFELKSRFTSRSLRALSWFEKRKLDLEMKVVDFLNLYDLSKVEFADSDGKYYFLKMMLLVRAMNGLQVDSELPMTVEEERVAYDRFSTRVLVKMDQMFEPAYQKHLRIGEAGSKYRNKKFHVFLQRQIAKTSQSSL